MLCFTFDGTEFTWDDVKADKHRENYIGHSLKAPVGRWQKGKLFFFYFTLPYSFNSYVRRGKYL